MDVSLAPNIAFCDTVGLSLRLFAFKGFTFLVTEDDWNIVLGKLLIKAYIQNFFLLFDDTMREFVLGFELFVMPSTLGASFSGYECSHIIEKRVRSR